MRKALNNALFQDVTTYTYVLDHTMYNAVIEGICETYPYLQGVQGENGDYPNKHEMRTSHKNYFQTYLQNQCRRGCRDIPEVAYRRNKSYTRNKGKAMTYTDELPNLYGIKIIARAYSGRVR